MNILPFRTEADVAVDHARSLGKTDGNGADSSFGMYFYHSDLCGSRAQSQACLSYAEMKQSVRSKHLGSASWITNQTGNAVQHLQYLPFGERYIDQRTAGYQERFTFSDEGNACGITDSKAQRERFAELYDFSTTNTTIRDEETGFGYFGARYYDSELLTGWMSVDPMADKYPSLSPYNYCTWNPIKLADPDGKEVYISGDAAGDAAGQLSSKGIIVTRDDATGRLSYTETGKRLSKSDRQLMAAINSKDVRVDVYATNKRNVEIDGLSLNNSSLMGQFLGVSLSDCIGKPRKKIRNAETRQLVNPSICQSRDNAFNVELGTSMRHEITESYQAGRICINEGISCGPSWASWNGKEIPQVKGDVYSRAHKLATPQADVRRIQINESWATSKAEMQKQYGFLGIPILLF